MHAITFEITVTNISGYDPDFHVSNSIGYAYETPTHFINMYGSNKGQKWYIVQDGLTASQQKHGDLEHWVQNLFGAKNIQTMHSNIGESIEGVWRPGLYFADHIHQALKTNEQDRRLTEQALRVLLDKLDDLFLYIEPNVGSLHTYSHKTRELLILACTELENFWAHYMGISQTPPNGGMYKTTDYVKLRDKLFLNEYEYSLRSFNSIPASQPFASWNAAAPSKSLAWYDAYNKTKHDRAKHFSAATLGNCIEAIAANIIMYIVRFGPYKMTSESHTFNSLLNQHFLFRLTNADPLSFYIPSVISPSDNGFMIWDSAPDGRRNQFVVKPLIL